MSQAYKTILLFVGCAIGLLACSPNGATPTSGPLIAPTSIPRSTATMAPPEQPMPQSNKGGFTTYDDPSAPFVIQYPVGWKVREEPESIFFQAEDQSASIQVITYEYLEGAPKNTTAKDVFNRFTQTFSQGSGLKLSNQITRSDASVAADVTFEDPATHNRLQGFLRVVFAKSRRYHFIVLFAADQSQFARYKPIGATVTDSFRER